MGQALSQAVALAAHGVQQTALAILLQFLAQVAHVYLDYIAGGGLLIFPHIAEDLIPAHHRTFAL